MTIFTETLLITFQCLSSAIIPEIPNNRFKENFKNVNFGPQNFQFTHVGQNKNFPKQSKTVTFTNSLIVTIRYNIGFKSKELL